MNLLIDAFSLGSVFCISYVGTTILLYTYCIAGKFGGDKVWQIYLFRTFGEKSLVNE